VEEIVKETDARPTVTGGLVVKPVHIIGAAGISTGRHDDALSAVRPAALPRTPCVNSSPAHPT
jgi:hypothetical protein